MTKTKNDIVVYFNDGSPPLHIEDCDPFDNGWAITFTSENYSWTIPKPKIKMITSFRRQDD